MKTCHSRPLPHLSIALGLLLLSALGRPAEGQGPPSAERPTLPTALPAFVANRGQWPAEVRFRYRQGPATAWLHDDGLSLALARTVLRLTFERAAPAEAPRGVDEVGALSNFYLGADPRRWATGVPAFARVEQAGLVPGVDVVWQQRDSRLTYDLEVAPGADPAAIVTRIDGAESLRVAPSGELIVQTAGGDIALTAPRSWEVTAGGPRPVGSRIRIIDAQRYYIDVDRVDDRAALVIDPGIEWATFLGGAGQDIGNAVRTDDSGRVYVTGFTEDAGGGPPLPTTTSVPYGGGVRDLFVSCFDPSLSGPPQLVWSTYVGGGAADVGHDLHVAPSGALTTVVGYSFSNDFPTTANAHMTAWGGRSDAIVAQLTNTGGIAYASYLGGSLHDRACAIESHSARGFLIAGYTNSADFPVTAGAFQTTLGGSFDAFAVHFDPLLAMQVQAATFLGGSGGEGPWNNANSVYTHDFLSVDVAPSGSLVVAGGTKSTDFPITNGAFRVQQAGDSDIFVSCLDASLATLTYSSYVGSAGEDGVWDVAVNRDGDLVVSGYTKTNSFPVTSGAYQTTFGGNTDAVLFVLQPAGLGSQDLRYSTHLGGAGHDWLRDLAVESSGVIVACGHTDGGGLQTTPGAMQSQYAGTWGMGFVMRLEPARASTSDMHYLSYLGGAGEGSWCVGLSQRADGRVAVTGATGSSAFPTTPGAFQTTGAGLDDAWVAILDLLPGNVTRAGAGSGACPGIDMQISAMPAPGATIDLICNDTPDPVATGALFLGSAASIPFLGIEILAQPLAAVPVTAFGGSARTTLSLPPSVTLPLGLACQYVWLATAACPNAGLFAASDALEF